MSRRTILLIAATVFVLLAIPGIYLACTWSTPNPLRFEVTQMEIDSLAPSYVTLNLTVRNTSNLPIYLDPPAMEATDAIRHTHWVRTRMVLILPGGSRKPFSEPFYLPPGGSVTGDLTFLPEGDADSVRKYLESMEVHYRWRSATVEKVHELRQWLISKGPQNFHLIIPLPKDSHDRTPLELPATTSP